jgi:hypothetical protein
MKSKIIVLSGSIVAIASGILGSGCGSSTPAATPASTAVTSASAGIGSVQANLQKYTPNLSDGSPTAFNFDRTLNKLAAFISPSAMATAYTPFGSLWALSSGMPDLYNSANHESLQNYMGQMIDPTFLNSNGSATGAAGRYVNALFQTCLTMAFLDSSCPLDTDGLPAVGTCSPTLSLASVPSSGTYQGCVIPSGFSAGGGGSLSLSVTISAVASNPNYTKKIVISGAPVGSGTATTTAFAKLDTSTGTLNFTTVSPGDIQSGLTGCGGSRFLMSLSGTTTQFEYASMTVGSDVSGSCSGTGTQSHEDYYRIHLDTAADTAYIMGMQHNYGSVNGLTFILSGQPSKIASNSGSISTSVWTSDGTAIPAGSSGSFVAASADACVSQSSGAITSDGALACDITGLDVISARTLLQARSTADFSTTTIPTASPTTPAAIAWTNAADFVTAQTSP